MGTKAYIMVKTKKTDGEDNRAIALKDLETMPEVEAAVPVLGEYDVIITVDTPAKAGLIAEKIESKGWLKNLRVLKVEPVQPNPFLDEVCSLPGGECVRWCMQCGMCSASCPNVNQMDYSPRKLIARIRAGRRYDVLSSNTMWICASCYLCTARCPKDVKITELMHSLERLSARHGLLNKVVSTPAMYKAFVDSIKKNGRVHEIGIMMQFYLKTNPFAALQMLPVAMQLMIHRRVGIKPTKIKGVKQIKAILERAQALGGT